MLAMILLAGLAATNASAQRVTILSSEGFTTNSLPSGWSGNWGSDNQGSGQWFWSSTGYGGSNGAAMDDIWDYNYTPLSTPPKDVSTYANSSDSVWADFDFFWEYNAYDPSYSSLDHINIDANSDVLVDGTVATLYTYYNTSDYNYDVAQASTSDWRHYHILIPVGDRTSSMKISWVFISGQGLSDIAIDNVTITAFHKAPGEFSLLPKSLNFGAATPNAPDTLCVTAYSLGAAPVHITGYNFSGSSAYSLVSGPAVGDSIVPGNSVQYCIQFLPLSGGTLSGHFTLTTDAADSGSQSVSLIGIGAVPAVSYGVTNLFHRVATMLGDTSAEQYIPVSSTGGGPLHFNNIYFIGLNANNYYVSRMPMNPLPVGVTDSIGIRFMPSIEGRPDASVVISTDASNKPLDTATLFGVGILPHLEITVPAPGSGNTVAFDSVAVGDSVCQTLTLTNTGSDTLQILKQLVTYGDYDFTFYPLTGSDTMILPGGTKLVNVCFKPLKVGTRLASIRFYTNIPVTFEKPRVDTSQFVINLTGVGVPYGHLAVIGSLNDTAIVGKTNCITDMLANNGQSDVTITSVKIAPSSANFTLTGVTTPFAIAPGQQLPVSLCYTAASRGTQIDTLFLSGTTSEKAVTTLLLLNGIGVETCVSADSLITFGSTAMTLVGVQDTSCVTVTNCGDLPATYTASTPNGTAYTLITPTTSAVIAPGGTAQFCVSFTPTSIGAANGSISISGGPNPTTTLLGGVGGGVLASASGAPAAPVAVDTCNSFDITIVNNGNVAWTPGTGTIGGANASDFTIVSGPTPSTIAAGGTGTVTVNFCPKSTGTESMALTFPSESPVPVAGAFSFTATGVGATSGVTLRTEQDGFVLGASYPNPTNGQAAIEVTLPKESSVRIDLLDGTGALVRTAFSGNLAQGTQTLALDAKGLPSGTYFYMLTSGDVRLTRQMSLIK